MRFTTRRPNPVFSEEYAAIREHIISARRRAGLSQRELASRIGKCHSHVTMIERGQRRIDTLELFAIATALGRGPAELFVEVAQRIEAVGRASGEQPG